MARRTKACPVGQRGRVGAWHWVCTGSCAPFTSWNLESSNWSFWNETALFRANLLHFASDQGRVIDDDRCTERNSIEVVLGTWWVCWRIRQENNSAFIPRRETCHIVSLIVSLLSSFAFSTRCIRLLCQGVEDSESGPAWLGLALWSPSLTWKYLEQKLRIPAAILNAKHPGDHSPPHPPPLNILDHLKKSRYLKILILYDIIWFYSIPENLKSLEIKFSETFLIHYYAWPKASPSSLTSPGRPGLMQLPLTSLSERHAGEHAFHSSNRLGGQKASYKSGSQLISISYSYNIPIIFLRVELICWDFLLEGWEVI